MACIYILYSSEKAKYYVGSSRENNAKIRLLAHNAGKTLSTKPGRPWCLVHEEACADYKNARKKEHFLKSGNGRAWIKKNLKVARMTRVLTVDNHASRNL